jgi:hypothetical protein
LLGCLLLIRGFLATGEDQSRGKEGGYQKKLIAAHVLGPFCAADLH